MNIAHIGKFKKDSTNGVNQCIYNIATRQAAQGNNVYVYTFSNIQEIKRVQTEEGVIIVYFPNHKLKGFILNKSMIKYLKLNKDNIDIYHIHSVFLPCNNMIAKYINVPYILTPHGGYSINCFKRSKFSTIKKIIYYTLFEKRLILNASAIHTLCSNEKEQLRYLNRIEKKVFILPNGVNIPTNISKDFMDKKSFNLVFLGRIDMIHKGLDIMLKGLKIYYENNPSDKFKFYIIGPDVCSHKKELIKYVKTNQMDNKVIFKDKIVSTEKEKLFVDDIDIFVHTSRWEGIPISVLEALSYKIPVLISKETNMADYIRDNKAGWVVEPNTPEKIAETLSLINYRNISDYSKNASNLAKEKFNWDIIVNELISQYKLVI